MDGRRIWEAVSDGNGAELANLIYESSRLRMVVVGVTNQESVDGCKLIAKTFFVSGSECKRRRKLGAIIVRFCLLVIIYVRNVPKFCKNTIFCL